MTEIRKKIQSVRCEVQKKCNKKSGKNAYAGFDYFQLEDFLPTANEEFNKVGLCPIYTIEYEGERQMAYLTIEDGDEKVVFKIPTADVVMGSKPNPIQSLGAMLTYTKRYLYMNCLELSEGDVVDATIGKEDPKPISKSPQKPNKKPREAKDLTDDELLKEIRKRYKEDEIKYLEGVKNVPLEKFGREALEAYYEHRKEWIDLNEPEKPFY